MIIYDKFKFLLNGLNIKKIYYSIHDYSLLGHYKIFRYFILGYALYVSPTFTYIMMGATFGLFLINFTMVNVLFLTKEERFPWFMIFIQPFYIIYDIIILSCGILYGLFYKIPIVLFTPRKRILENEKIKKIRSQYNTIK